MDSLPKILVIDPDARACRALRDTLEGAGFATTGAHSEARGRTLLDEPPRPLALVVGASDPFWRDGMVNDFRSFDRDLVIVAVLLPGDEYEALLELGASACASAIGIDALLPPLLLRLLHGKRTRSAPSVAPPPIAPGSAGRVPSVPTFGRPPAREALANRLDELFREASASGRPEAGPVEVRFPTWEDYGKVAAQLKRGSLFVETTTPRQVADEVRVRIVVPGGRSVEIAAEVGNVVSRERAATTGRPAGMGVRFVDLGDEQQHALAAFEQAYRTGGEPAAAAAASGGERPRSPAPGPPSVDRFRVPSSIGAPTDRSQPAGSAPLGRQRTATAPGGAAPAPPIPTSEVERRRVPTQPFGFDVRPIPPAQPAPPGRASVPPPRASAPRVDPAVGGGRTKAEVLRDHLAALVRADCFSVLGVSVDVTPEDLRLAFVGLAKKWHPNKYATDGPEVRGLATEIFITLKKARDTLSDPKKLATHRARYEAATPSAGDPRRGDEARLASPSVDDARHRVPGGR